MKILERDDILKHELGGMPINEDEIPLSDMSETYSPDEESDEQSDSK